MNSRETASYRTQSYALVIAFFVRERWMDDYAGLLATLPRRVRLIGVGMVMEDWEAVSG
jgi:hypothetical protein